MCSLIRSTVVAVLWLAPVLVLASTDELRVGWAAVDITPDGPVAMRGGIKSAGVKDPVTATVLALERVHGGDSQTLFLISCDLQHITDGTRSQANMRDEVRRGLHAALPEVAPERVILMATHTHVAPSVQNDAAYLRFASERIVNAARQAWQGRKPGGISFGLGHAVAGHNRIVTHRDGTSRMSGDFQKGKTSHADFSHIEGFEDHSVHLLYTWDTEHRLTGVVVNVPCPAQVQRGNLISADYWHEVRQGLKHRLGPEVFVLPQLSSAGDVATTVMVEKKAEARMQRLMFPDLDDERDRRRRQIALEICDAVTKVLPYIKDHVEWKPALRHSLRQLELPLGFPEPDQNAAGFPVEVHAARIGDLAMVTCPFEFYLDYGIRIKGRSPAIQTFVIQLTGSGSYLPTERAVKGGAYGAIDKTCIVGPGAGDQIVNAALELLGELWAN